MTQWFMRRFVKESDVSSDNYRKQVGLLGGWIGLVSNLLLFFVKFLSGIFSGSIAIMTDAINNLSDSSSSLITLIGFKLSSAPADEEHPYGHARYEYISGLLVSCLIVIIGVQFLISSVKKTINPTPIDFHWLIALLLLISIGAKIAQGIVYNGLGKAIDSDVLLATAIDSRNDVLITAVVLVSSIVQSFTGWLLDGPMGLVVSGFVIYSGIQLISETLSPLLGEAPDEEMVKVLTDKILSYPSVIGCHDLILHSYGPGKIYATVHVEMPAQQDIMVSHDIIDTIERDVTVRQGIDLVIHMDPVDISDPALGAWRKSMEGILEEIDPSFSFHDFRLVKSKATRRLIFDLVVPPRHPMKNGEIRSEIQQKVAAIDPDTLVFITIDRSYVSEIE